MTLLDKAQKFFHDSFSNLPSSLSLSIRLQFLTVIAVMPLWGVIIFTALDQRAIEINRIQAETTILAAILASEHNTFIENGRQLAMTLAVDPALNENQECENFLNKLMKENNSYMHFVVLDKTGEISCAATEFEKPMHFSDHQDFLKNLALSLKSWPKNKIRVDYEINSAARKTFINFSAPIFDGAGALQKIAVAIADSRSANKLLENLNVSDNEAFIIFNEKGIILTRYPEPEKWIGLAMKPEPELTALMNQGTGTDYFTGIDGVERFYAVKKITQNPNLYAGVGVTKNSIFSDANRIFQRNIILTIMVTLIGLVIARWLGKALFYERTEAMQELNNLKTDFISLTSHQLRTPLTSIRWFTELLLLEEAGKISPAQKEFLEEVRNATNSLIGLVNKLLNVSRVRGKRLKVSPKPTDLLELSQELIKELEPQIIEKSIRFNFHSPKSLPQINIDPILIRQAILNLLSNAVKYTPKNGSVNFSIKQRPQDIYLLFSDTGIGIPKTEQKYVFERFFRASNASKTNTEGVGVGLFLIKNLIEISGGQIGFTSKENKGSAFWFTLPLKGSRRVEGETALSI